MRFSGKARASTSWKGFQRRKCTPPGLGCKRNALTSNKEMVMIPPGTKGPRLLQFNAAPKDRRFPTQTRYLLRGVRVYVHSRGCWGTIRSLRVARAFRPGLLARGSVAGVLSEPRRAVLDRSSAEDALGIRPVKRRMTVFAARLPFLLRSVARLAWVRPLYRRELEPERAAERRRRHPRQACLGAFIAWHRLVEFLHRDF